MTVNGTEKTVHGIYQKIVSSHDKKQFNKNYCDVDLQWQSEIKIERLFDKWKKNEVKGKCAPKKKKWRKRGLSKNENVKAFLQLSPKFAQ